ncbi:MAG: NADH-quinone oxidoreductase subunit H [archaeon]|nr:NADH-quinone oxidoreductase subunit H [archaeon]
MNIVLNPVIINSVIAVIITVLICLVVSTFLPGIERKYVHARIQQRIGPPVTSPGIFAPIKFMFKENIEPNSPVSGLYKALPIVCFLVVLCLIIISTPQLFAIPALASIVAIVGLLKVEEVCYVLMGALSKSIMSLPMPFPDTIKGAVHRDSERSFIEDLSAKRSLRMIAYGSFPLYLALFVPVTQARSIFLPTIVSYQFTHGPVLFTASGIVGAIVFFIGYMIMLNEYPFSIIKAKSDVIEGPYMEYASKYRAVVYITRGFLMFTLAALFLVLYCGIPLFGLGIIFAIIAALVFVLFMGIFSAFTPVFTNKQLYPVIVGLSLLGVLAIVLGLL